MIYYFYKVDKEKIYLIKNILEAYEDIFSLSTINNDIPKIQIAIAPDFLEDAEAILADLQERFFMQKIDEDSTISQGNY